MSNEGRDSPSFDPYAYDNGRYMATLRNFGLSPFPASQPQSRFFHPLPMEPSSQFETYVQGNYVPRPASPVLQSLPNVATTSNPQKETDKKRRTRIVWGTQETHILIEIWEAKFVQIKGASNAAKKKIWEKIFFDFESTCRRQNVPIKEMSVDQIKKRITNLEYDYRQIRTKMANTGEKGANKLKGDFAFFDALDEVLGSRDAANPDLMTIESTTLTPPESQSSSSLEQEDLSTGNETSNEADVSESGSENQAFASALKDRRTPPFTKSAPSNVGNKRKRKPPPQDRETTDEDPYMKRVCEMWKVSFEKQDERFSRTMELQQEAMRNQTEQTKMLVDGLKDMIKEILK